MEEERARPGTPEVTLVSWNPVIKHWVPGVAMVPCTSAHRLSPRVEVYRAKLEVPTR